MDQPEPATLTEPLQRLKVTVAEDGQAIERFLDRRLPGRGWGYVGKLLRQGRVTSGARVLARGDGVRAGALIEIAAKEGAGSERPPQPNRKIRLTVLHEDEHLVGLLKPAPLAMHPGPGHGTDTLLNALVGRFPELVELGGERGWGLVQRLDRETSGVLVVARSPQAYEALVAAFSERRVQKTYLALAYAKGLPATATLTEPIDGKEAVTELRLLERLGPLAKLELTPRTGRTHQLRLHLAGLGAPILGDARHGRGRDAVTAQLYLGRLALHAARLELEHPLLEGERVVLAADWPRDLRKAWARAGKLWGQERGAPPT